MNKNWRTGTHSEVIWDLGTVGTHESRSSPQIPQTEKESRQDTEGSELAGRRVVTSYITRNSEASQESKDSSKEGRTYTSLATARARSASEVPWEHKWLYQPPPWHGHTSTGKHIHAHTYQQVQSSRCLLNNQSTTLAHRPRPNGDLDGLANVISALITFKCTK